MKHAGRRPVRMRVPLSHNHSAKGDRTKMFPLNRRTILRFTALLLCSGILGRAAITSVSRADKTYLNPQERSENSETEKDSERDKYLFVWAGDQARINPDF